jgi:hypothetical protein
VAPVPASALIEAALETRRGVTDVGRVGRAQPRAITWLGLWAPVGLYMGLIFAISSRSAIEVPQDGLDKVAHVGMYAGLSVLLTRALAGGLPAPVDLETALIAIGAAIAYGVSDEWHQLFVAGRFADRADVLADAVGAAVGACACWAWGTLHARPRH